MGFGAQVKGIRGADAQVKTLKDVGDYDVFTSIILQSGQTGELMGFSYAVGGQTSGVAINATKIDTNMRVANQFVDESMSVYAVAIQVERLTQSRFQEDTNDGPYTLTLDDFRSIEAHTLFRLHVGGDKPFAEGLVTWFGEGGGIAGMSNANNGEVLANNVPTIAAVRRWDFRLPIGRIEKFWCELLFPARSPTIQNIPNTNRAGRVSIKVRLLGVRARGVQ